MTEIGSRVVPGAAQLAAGTRKRLSLVVSNQATAANRRIWGGLRQ